MSLYVHSDRTNKLIEHMCFLSLQCSDGDVSVRQETFGSAVYLHCFHYFDQGFPSWVSAYKLIQKRCKLCQMETCSFTGPAPGPPSLPDGFSRLRGRRWPHPLNLKSAARP